MIKILLRKIIWLSSLTIISGIFSGVALADTNCANGSMLTSQEAMQAYAQGLITVSFNKISSSEVKVLITNNTSCVLPATVQSYKVYDNNSFDSQVRIYDAGLTNISANSNKTFDASISSCLTQVDAFYDNRNTNSQVFVGKIFGPDGRTFDSIPSADGVFCLDTPPPPVPNTLSVSCSVDDSSVDVDEDVRYTANVSGGNGNYVYNWSGTDGVFNTNRSFNWSYDDTGTKRTTVTVFSGSESVSDTCSVKVSDNSNNDNLSVSCYADDSSVMVGDRVRWIAEVDGDDGDIDYDWSGDDGLDSSSKSPSMYYNTPGTKEAEVRVRSNGDSDTARCTVRVSGNTVLSYSQYNPNNQVLDAVYLNEVPYTGLADNKGLIWFIVGLLLVSAYLAYIFIAYKKNFGPNRHQVHNK